MVADGGRPENQANAPENVGLVLPVRGYPEEAGGGDDGCERREEGCREGGERAPGSRGQREGEEESSEAGEAHDEAAGDLIQEQDAPAAFWRRATP